MAFPRVRHALLTTTFCGGLSLTLAAFGAPQHAAKGTNPVPSTPESIAAGKATFDKNCASCHGPNGKGDGKMGEELSPKPADLTDNKWKHGSSDGEIFKVIHDGAQGTGMKPFGRKLSEHEIWDVVNYIRSIGPPTTR